MCCDTVITVAFRLQFSREAVHASSNFLAWRSHSMWFFATHTCALLMVSAAFRAETMSRALRCQ